jgi:light-regulated signal transduction histidine kinase (bacteriophytochrome)
MGQAAMRQEAIDLHAIVQEVLAGLETVVANRTVRWTVEPLPMVVGDRAMVRQVLTNLIGNAVKYTGQREVACITVGAVGMEDGRHILTVRDNGAGFDMAYADKLFGVFQRLHRAEDFEGTGIGLAIVRRIIMRHGGRVWADAAVDQGATFFFTLAPYPHV